MDLLHINDEAGKYPASYYAADAQPLALQPTASGDIKTDVCIVGAGFTGLSAALHLARAGYQVTVLEAQRIGFGASGRNGGQVGTGQRLDQEELEKLVGLKDAKQLWGVALDAVQLVKDLCKEIPNCDVRQGIIHAAHRARYVQGEHDYAQKLNEDYDYASIRPVDLEEMRELVGSPAYYGGTLDTNAGHIQPLRYALGLAQLAMDAGAKIYECSQVKSIEKGAVCKIKTGDAVISADYVLLACNGYLGGLDTKVAARVMPINNFIVATEPLDDEMRNSLISYDYAVADSKFVVNYFRLSDDGRMLFGGTESYGYRFPKNIAKNVRKPMLEIFPQLKNAKIDYAWGGTLGITMNRMPCFRRDAGNILSASGYSGHGVAMASLGGKLAAMAMMGQAEKFDLMASVPTSRFPGGSKLRSPMLVLAMLWYSLRDKL